MMVLISSQISGKQDIGRKFSTAFPLLGLFRSSAAIRFLIQAGACMSLLSILTICLAILLCRSIKALSQKPWTTSGPNAFQLEILLHYSLIIAFVILSYSSWYSPVKSLSVFNHSSSVWCCFSWDNIFALNILLSSTSVAFFSNFLLTYCFSLWLVERFV